MKSNLINDQDQAENLRAELSENKLKENDLNSMENNLEQTSEVDILNLPKRSSIHDKNKKKASFKFNKTFFRFLMVILFVVIILGLGFYIKYINK